MYDLSVLKAIILVTRMDITSYFSSLSVYCGDKYVALDLPNFRLTSTDCGLAVSLICSQNSRN